MTASDVGHDAEQPTGRMFADLSGSLVGEPDHRAPLILLHGPAFDRTMWRPVLAELRELDPRAAGSRRGPARAEPVSGLAGLRHRGDGRGSAPGR